ncbi:hypothetical protein ACP70R_049346 [Stipagrostis hirtigluma subsp. patula]
MAASALTTAAGAGARRLSRSTTIKMGAVSGHHIFRVEGYSQTKDIPNGKYMNLGGFDVGGNSWSVEYYPNGSGSDHADYISLYLNHARDPSNSSMPARFKFSMLGQDGEPVSSFTRTSQTHRFNGESYGYRQFVERKEFENSACLKDDSFAIRCDVFVAAAEPSNEETGDDDGAPPPAVVPPKSDLQKDLAHLLWNKQGTDVTIDVGGETFHAHRWLLAARSAEFKETVNPAEKKAATRIQIEDMEPLVFKSLLHFMYTDTLPKTEEEAMSAMASGLLAAADRYKVERLKTICEGMLCKRVDTRTVATSLVLSEKHNCRALKAACMEFLSSPVNLEAVMANDGLETVKTSCPAVLLELTMKLLASEKLKIA